MNPNEAEASNPEDEYLTISRTPHPGGTHYAASLTPEHVHHQIKNEVPIDEDSTDRYENIELSIPPITKSDLAQLVQNIPIKPANQNPFAAFPVTKKYGQTKIDALEVNTKDAKRLHNGSLWYIGCRELRFYYQTGTGTNAKLSANFALFVKKLVGAKRIEGPTHWYGHKIRRNKKPYTYENDELYAVLIADE